MRQVGFLAAAGLYALDSNIERLKDDHKKAKEIASVLAAASYVKKVEAVETNIIIFSLNDTIDEIHFLNTLEEKQIRISNLGQGKIRIVTHLDYSNEMHDRLLTTFKAM